MIIATIPVGLAGIALEHTFRTTLGKPVPAALFLTLNGLVLFTVERLRAHRDPTGAARRPIPRSMTRCNAPSARSPAMTVSREASLSRRTRSGGCSDGGRVATVVPIRNGHGWLAALGLAAGRKRWRRPAVTAKGCWS